ncbi:Permease of the drug/metabolite transporter (DMT) superfamily [Sphingomonas guangdongensis]|uniref:Permease of the drug/metabolite transporter (DMT) superfamily n=1 Tax=Sphingomonas guangdongensis TaxID=1141890 RepID=A0A285QCF7_9SPHN|nr:EamA family transporter [Sphingomonas guangdongensis]SOB79635.1 Permease of the drug/metabolite transporter (DMT) superfamily [Sphingomonas guangdongensis]
MNAADRPQATRAGILIPFAIVTLIWGSTWLVITGQLGVVPPSWSVSYRFAVGGAAMLGYAAWRGERARLDASGWAFAAALGMLQFVCNFNFVYRAEQYITSGLVAVVFALLLVPNALLGRLFLGQRLGTQLLVGSAIAVCGVALLFLHEVRADPGNTAALLAGLALTGAGVLSASCANVMQGTALARRFPMIPTIGVAMLLGALFDALYAWATVGPPVFDPRPSYWLGVVYLGVAASAIAFPLYFGIIRVVGPAKAAYSSVLVPVIAMLLSTLFEGYRWSPLAAAGALLVIGGLVTALTARRPNR